ncbi:LytR/AlgR family response regulator transcription factor [Leeuwenhoekiella sp. W20_SRS_FM14]|uniref:LytR/AlgR family response regulator transcription factor n=1 Tax=Leeuwenhoekiella sp. W20_SRS_FM14 TaxID=3240270 RepID=UPI003F95F894
MIRYILVDDDQKTLERVKVKIDSIAKDYDLKHIANYSSSKAAAESITQDSYDLLIVDFEMPVFNGLELAEKIAVGKKVIFLTSTKDNEKRVINAIDIAGYLTKPFEIQEFENVLKKKILINYNTAKNHQNTQNYFLSVSKNRDINIVLDKVYYIRKGRQNYVNVYGYKDEIIFKNVRRTISDLAKELECLNFITINQSVIVNKNWIKERDNSYVELFDCKESFEIKQSFKSSFIAKIKNAFSRL